MKVHQEKVFIVTGAGRGLGRVYAQQLGAEGACIAVAEIDATTGGRTAEELHKSGVDAIYIETDVSSKSSTEAMATCVLERWGRIDGLVANAGLANSVGGAMYNEITVE